MIFLKELIDHVDEELKELFSYKDTEQYIALTSEMLELSHHLNSSQLIKSCRLRKGFDYVSLNFKDHQILGKKIIEMGLCKNVHVNKTTLFFESAIWKVALNSKNKIGDELKDVLSNKILPNLSNREPNSSIISSIKSIQ